MEKEFVPYKIALVLKELEFDKPCFAYYSNEELVYSSHTNNYMQRFRYAAPTYSQAFRFFREKHNLIGLVEGGYDDGKNIFTYVIWTDFKDDWCNDYVSTYEEAELACLRKLIEIVKNTSTSK